MNQIRTGHAEDIRIDDKLPDIQITSLRDEQCHTAQGHTAQAGNWAKNPAVLVQDYLGERPHVARVPISSLLGADSPRLSGEKTGHSRALAESGAELPPIIVHRATLRVIDGIHRLRAAKIRKRHDIEVIFFDGDEKDAFVLAVKTNIAHGLPLSLADRRAAAARILRSHPQWSDRMVATTSGLSPKTVRTIRQRCCPAEEGSQPGSRVGRDGRTRPVGSIEGRRIASRFIADNPNATLRTIAAAAGISPTTARDVRERMRRGHYSTPPEQCDDEPQNDEVPRSEVSQLASARSGKVVLQSLRKDPSLRFTVTGRVLLRLLDAHSIDHDGWRRLIDNVPAHCASMVAGIARECAAAWNYFAQEVERRAQRSGAI